MAFAFKLPLFCMVVALSAAAISAAAPAPAVDCSSLVLNMAECLSYVTVGGTAKKPTSACCDGLKTVLKTDADCLCEAFKNSAQFGVTLNVSKAVALPDACHVSGHSVGSCALSIGAAPALAPLAVSPSSVAGAPTAGIGDNEAAPAPAPAANSGFSAVISSIELLLLSTLVAVLYALF